ncbi:MAG: glycosyltransferase [Solobacterium sp.]|nr:glycosyltransferase [Solobacterium sp.]
MDQNINSPLVSVIITIYNTAPWLEACLDSVANQSLTDIQIVCVDDGSTDSSRDILEEYRRKDSRITIISQENHGISAARNAGVRAAEGRFLYFVDADDWIEPETLGVLAVEMVERELDILCLNGICYGDDEQTQAFADEENQLYLQRNLRTDGIYTGAELFCRQMENGSFASPVWLSMISRRCFLEQELWFRPGVIHEDEVYTCLALLKAGRAENIDEMFYHRRFRANSIITSGPSFSSSYGFYRAAEDIRPALEDLPLRQEEQSAVRKRIRLLQHLSIMEYLRCTPEEKQKYRLVSTEEQEKYRQTIIVPAEQGELYPQEKPYSIHNRMRRRFGSTAPYRLGKDVKNAALRVMEKAAVPARKVRRDLHRSALRKQKTVIQLRSRLGNQMFIYAFARKLASQGVDVEFDDRTMTRYGEPGYNPSLLMNAFGITFPRAERETVEAFLHTNRLHRKRTNVMHEADDFAYDTRFFGRPSGYYTGWFQNSSYFEDIQEEIRDCFRFRTIDPQNTAAREAESRILADEDSCAVHMRFGDYIGEAFSKKYQGFCTDEYYRKAIRTVQERRQGRPLHLYVFSDDHVRASEWFASHKNDPCLSAVSVIPVDVCTERDSWIDMYLMSLCRHNIIANSTFSWWSAFLNRNPDRIAVVPQFWLRDKGKVYPGVRLANETIISPDGETVR